MSPSTERGRIHLRHYRHLNKLECEDDILAIESEARAAVLAELVLTGRDVHREWRNGMLAQGRYVAPERMSWDTLDPYDRELDDCIAGRILLDLIR